MIEAFNQQDLESHYLGRTISKIDLLPTLLQQLRVVDPDNSKYSLRYLTLQDDTILFFLDHVSTNRLCSNTHHINIFTSYQSSHPGTTPVDAGYLEFDPTSTDQIIYLAKSANSLVHYQLRFDNESRQRTIDILSPHLSKIGYKCQNSPYVSKPDIPQTEFWD